jgi:hypothetical protein
VCVYYTFKGESGKRGKNCEFVRACGLFLQGVNRKKYGAKNQGGKSAGRAFVFIVWACFLFVGIACRVYCKLKAIYQLLAVKNICQNIKVKYQVCIDKNHGQKRPQGGQAPVSFG